MAATVWPESTYELSAGLGLTVCVAHKGEHYFYQGACVDVRSGRRKPFAYAPLRRCIEPGCNFAEEVPHSHQPPVEPVRVEIDEAKLAAGIAIALDQLMQKRREAARANHAPEPAVARDQNGSSSLLDSYQE